MDGLKKFFDVQKAKNGYVVTTYAVVSPKTHSSTEAMGDMIRNLMGMFAIMGNVPPPQNQKPKISEDFDLDEHFDDDSEVKELDQEKLKENMEKVKGNIDKVVDVFKNVFSSGEDGKNSPSEGSPGATMGPMGPLIANVLPGVLSTIQKSEQPGAPLPEVITVETHVFGSYKEMLEFLIDFVSKDVQKQEA